MSWPLSQDYNEAIQSPASNFTDPDLKRGEAVANALGLPMPYSGNFADVYQVRCPDGKSWAVKCFTREATGLRERYQEISAHLKQAKLPFTVDFSYLEKGMRVAGTWYPVLKMQWVEGLTLNQFIGQNLEKPVMLEALLQLWARMGKYLRAAEIGHCDLQHGNVLLVPGATPNSLALKLIDYDGMWVPGLAGKKSGEVGHPCYQHPQRLREGTYSLDVDRFPLLLVATAMRALKADKGLWAKYDNGDNMLFKESDLAEPGQSEVFQELASLPDAGLVMLAAHVRAALKGPLESAPLLEDAMPDAKGAAPAPAAKRPSKPASAAEGPRSGTKVSPVAVAPVVAPPPAAEKAFAFDESASAAGVSSTRLKRTKSKATEKAGGLPPWVWIAGAAAAVVLIGGGAAAFVAMSGPPKPPVGPQVTQQQPPGDSGSPGKPPVKPPSGPTDPVKEPVKPGDKPDSNPITANGEPDGIDPNPKGPAEEIRRFEGHTQGIFGVAYSPDGRLIASAGDDTIRLWDATTAKEIQTLTGHTAPAWHVAFSPDGKQLLSGGRDKTMWLWEVAGGRQLQRFEGHTDMVDAVAFCSDKTRVFSASRDGTCRIWNADTGHEVGQCGKGPLRLYALAATADGGRLLFTANDESVCLWDVREGRELKRMPGHAGDVYALAFSPDGKYGLSGGWDKTIRLWNLEDGTEVRRFDGHTAAVQSAAFSPDGRRILSGSEDKTIRLWNVDTGKEICRLEGHSDQVRSVAFSPSGRYAISGSSDKTVRLWRLPPTESTPVPQATSPFVGTWQVDHEGISENWTIKENKGDLTVSGVVVQKGMETGRFKAEEIQYFNGVLNFTARYSKTPPTWADTAKVTAKASGDMLAYDWSYGNTSGHREMVRTKAEPIVGTNPTPDTTPAVKAPDSKPAAPDDASLAAAEKEVKDLYKAEFAKKKKEDVLALADKLRQQGIDTKDKPATRFVLFRESRDLAAQAGDFVLSRRAVDEMANNFAVNVQEMNIQAVEAARSVLAPGAMVHVAEAALVTAEEAEDGDDYDMTDRAIKATGVAAHSAGSPALEKIVRGRATEIEALRKAWEPAKAAVQTLTAKRDDPDANLALGKFYCLDKGNWDLGLPMLALGSDAKLKDLAQKDLSSPADAEAREELARTYATLAEAESGALKTQFLRRASYWYQEAEAQLMGISRTEATKKVAEVEKGLPLLPPKILWAAYGGYNSWVDVTATARSMLVDAQAKGQKLAVKADSGELGIGDPLPFKTKTLVVVYRHREQVRLGIAKDGDAVAVPGQGAQDTESRKPAPGQELVILYARVGAEATFADATARAQQLVQGPSLVANANDLVTADPFPGRQKAVIVVYSYGGKVRLSVTPQEEKTALGAASAKP